MADPPPILHADHRLAVLNKPAGLPCHPARAGGPSVEDWFPHLTRRRDGPWLAHRLDRDTAGCLVVALRKAALIAIQRQLAAGLAEKTYWAIVVGAPASQSGTIENRLARHQAGTHWRIVATDAGQPAITAWRVRGAAGPLTWLELQPRTGRTHQLRVHCAALGCPILGDPIYGDPTQNPGAPGLHLLARAIRLPLDPPVAAQAPPPPHMLQALRACGY